jgi:hypothetical protein
MDYLYLGPTPFEEDAIQLSPTCDTVEMRKQVRDYVAMLEKRFPNAPDEAYISIKSEYHEYGTYYEAIVKYNKKDEDAVKFAFCVESNLPARWNDKEKIDWKTQVLEEV